jgi:DNA repair protein RadC
MEKISEPEDSVRILKEVMATFQKNDLHREFCYSIGLDSQNRVLYVENDAMGGLTHCSPNGREIFTQAIARHAHSIILCHNHPSGINKVSDEDVKFTKEFIQGNELLRTELNVLDHIVITGDTFISFRLNGLLD